MAGIVDHGARRVPVGGGDRKSGGEGKRVELGGGRIIKKKKKNRPDGLNDCADRVVARQRPRAAHRAPRREAGESSYDVTSSELRRIPQRLRPYEEHVDG